MADDNFVKWLENMEPAGRGRQVALARKTGLSQPYISKLLRRKTKQDLALTTLAEIANHMGVPLNKLAEEIYGIPAVPGKPLSEVVVPIDAKYRKEWDDLFRHNPARGRRVLENLILQERQGYTDLVSKIVTAILAVGPQLALSKIGTEIDKWASKNDSKKARKIPPHQRKLSK